MASRDNIGSVRPLFDQVNIELTSADETHIATIMGQGSKGTGKWAGPLTDFYIGKLIAKHSEHLNRTTKALTLATIVLAIATIALVVVTIS